MIALSAVLAIVVLLEAVTWIGLLYTNESVMLKYVHCVSHCAASVCVCLCVYVCMCESVYGYWAVLMLMLGGCHLPLFFTTLEVNPCHLIALQSRVLTRAARPPAPPNYYSSYLDAISTQSNVHNLTCCIYIGIQKLSSVLKAVKGPNYHYAEVKIGYHNLPKSHSKFTTEPRYEKSGRGVTSSNVAMEENPAYQSVEVAVAKP